MAFSQSRRMSVRRRHHFGCVLVATVLGASAGGLLVATGASAAWGARADAVRGQGLALGHSKRSERLTTGGRDYVVSVSSSRALEAVADSVDTEPDNTWDGPLVGFSAQLTDAQVALLRHRHDVVAVEP